MSDQQQINKVLELDPKSFRHKVRVGFIIFGVFFIYYIGCAILQTPDFQHIASISFLGMPLGFVLSMGIFPVSWILLIIYFVLWR